MTNNENELSPAARLITWLNACFPRLSALHECLLALSAVVTVAYSLLHYTDMGPWAVAPGIMLMLLVWRKPPPARWERFKWAFVTSLFGLVLTGAVYIEISLRLARL